MGHSENCCIGFDLSSFVQHFIGINLNYFTDRTDQPELVLNLDPFDELKIPSVVGTSIASGMAQNLSNRYKEYLSSKGYPGFTSQSNMQDYVLGVAEDSVDQYNRYIL